MAVGMLSAPTENSQDECERRNLAECKRPQNVQYRRAGQTSVRLRCCNGIALIALVLAIDGAVATAPAETAVVSVERLRSSLSSLPTPWSDERIRHLVAALDPGARGYIARADLTSLSGLAVDDRACDRAGGPACAPADASTTLSLPPQAVHGPAFMRGEAPAGKAGRKGESRYYFRPYTSKGGDDDPAFERCAARCLSAEFSGKCWFISTAGERECSIHTGLFAFTSLSV